MTQPKISLQMIFNAGWQAFIIEGQAPCQTSEGCRYSLPNGTACIVGLTLPPEHPSRKFIGGFSMLVRKYPELFDDRIVLLNETHPHKLLTFQRRLHDSLCEIKYQKLDGEYHEVGPVWKKTREEREAIYRDVAKDFSLTIPGVTND